MMLPGLFEVPEVPHCDSQASQRQGDLWVVGSEGCFFDLQGASEDVVRRMQLGT